MVTPNLLESNKLEFHLVQPLKTMHKGHNRIRERLTDKEHGDKTKSSQHAHRIKCLENLQEIPYLSAYGRLFFTLKRHKTL